MASLSFADVWKEYGEVQALRGLDLEVPDGELITIVGPSGCGKSTALRSAAGLEEVTRGAISIGGRDVTKVPAGKRNVSMVFQSYALFPHLTVKENIAFGLAARRVPEADAGAASAVGGGARRAARDLFDRHPYQLSGGERQRVALARALVRRPDVYLLDEPLSNLDAQLRVRMRAELKQLHQRLGSTMVYVTHDQVEALTLGDRVAVLNEGVLQQVATPTEIYRRPVNRFVGTFIGSPAMNVLPLENVDGVFRAGPFVLGQRESRRASARARHPPGAGAREHGRVGRGSARRGTGRRGGGQRDVPPPRGRGPHDRRAGGARHPSSRRHDGPHPPGAGPPLPLRRRDGRGRLPVMRDFLKSERFGAWAMLAPYILGLAALVLVPGVITFALRPLRLGPDHVSAVGSGSTTSRS